MNIKSLIAAFAYMSLFRLMSLDVSQSCINNHFDRITVTLSNQQIESNSLAYSTAQRINFLEEPTVRKLNIAIQMIVRSVPRQLPSSPSQSLSSSFQGQRNHRYTYPAHFLSTTQMPCRQTSSYYILKSATSLIQKTQEVLFC
jgi:hypothetical protein